MLGRALALNLLLLSSLPASVGWKPGPVAALIQAAKDTDSTGSAVLKDGKFIAGFGERRAVMSYSVTKAIVGMAAGRLFTEGKWSQLDAPIATLLPEFDGDPQGAVTLRQLMSHTSGIRDRRDAAGHVLKDWNEAKDWIQAALRQPMHEPPGTVFLYNHQGPALVAAAVERATGARLDQFLERTLFEPLCITGTRWDTDAAGHAAGYTGLSISALNLAKLGQLILNRGQWGSTQVMSEYWVRRSALTSLQAGGQYLMIFPNHLGQLVANHLIKAQRP